LGEVSGSHSDDRSGSDLVKDHADSYSYKNKGGHNHPRLYRLCHLIGLDILIYMFIQISGVA